MKTLIITAAGGNPTAIREVQMNLTRDEYEKYGKKLMLETEKYGVEQAGFLIPRKTSLSHFEMSGGEFCGNAARSASLFLFLKTGESKNSFTMSGFSNVVSSVVQKIDKTKFNVKCEFPEFNLILKDVKINNTEAKLVDLGGIVHVVINEEFPSDYEDTHRLITKKLGLEKRDAVGVIWIKEINESITMHPVVWVRSIDTFFYETSCGSGTIAVSKTTGISSIIQPSGGIIKAEILGNTVFLESEMEIVYEKQEEVEYLIASEYQSDIFKKKFIDLYKEAFGGPPYFEEYEDDWVEENVWGFHLKHGCVVLALHNDDLIGLGCAIPTSEDGKVFEFLSSQEKLPFDLGKSLYMSELAVSSLFRKSELHVGSELVKKRIDWAKNNGFNAFVMRTAAKNSNSENLYRDIIGAKKIEGLIQNVLENPQEVSSSSDQRIYFYDII